MSGILGGFAVTRDADRATTERRTCSHHWVIQPADGPVSLGVCKFCRETREFRNYIDVWEWNPPNRQPTPLAAEAEEDE